MGFMREVGGPRHRELGATEQRIGVTREVFFLAGGGDHDQVVMYLEGESLEDSLGAFIASREPFDVWFKERFAACTGVDLNDPPPPGAGRAARLVRGRGGAGVRSSPTGHAGGRRSAVTKSWIAIVVLEMSLGQVALAEPALGAAEVPFRGSDSGGFELSGSCPGGEVVVINGTGHATHLGAYAYTATECFDLQNGTFAGSATLTAANGAAMVGTYQGQVSGTADPAVISYHEELELSGGTGRFAGATGTLQVVGAANLSTLEYEQILNGTVSRPDSTPAS